MNIFSLKSKDFEAPVFGLCFVVGLLVLGTFKLTFDKRIERPLGFCCNHLALEFSARRQNEHHQLLLVSLLDRHELLVGSSGFLTFPAKALCVEQIEPLLELYP